MSSARPSLSTPASAATETSTTAPARPGLRPLLAVLTLLIAYVSLYPFRFRTEMAMVEPPFSALDMVANVLLFLPFGLLVRWLAADGHDDRAPARNRLALGLLAGAALAAGLQWLQLFVPGRLASLMDVGTNWIGLGLGAFIAPWLAPARWQRFGGFWLDSRAGLLLLLWLTAELSPFLPGDPVRAWTRQLYLFRDLLWQPLLLIGQVVGWLLVFALCRHRLRARWLWLLVLLTLALQPWLLGNGLRREELLAPLLAYGLHALGLRSAGLLLIVLAGFLVWRGLTPFDWQGGPLQFHWLPFGAVVSAPFPYALATLAEKAFWYGGLYELGCRLGWRPSRWLAVLVLALLALELLQLGLARHRAELTDPLLLLTMALLLRSASWQPVDENLNR